MQDFTLQQASLQVSDVARSSDQDATRRQARRVFAQLGEVHNFSWNVDFLGENLKCDWNFVDRSVHEEAVDEENISGDLLAECQCLIAERGFALDSLENALRMRRT